MKATIEDICLRDRIVYVLCDYGSTSEPSYIKADVSFDCDQDIGLDELYDANDNRLSEILPAPLYAAVVAIIHRDFDPVHLARNHLLDHDGEAGKLFRRNSRLDRDWDTIAKEQRMDRAEREGL
jgi:hypothetical protein